MVEEKVKGGVFYTVKDSIATDKGIVDTLLNADTDITKALVYYKVIQDMRITQEMLKKDKS
jgi:hypothetical protein